MRPPPGSGDALVRVFDDCAADATLYSDRGGNLTQGAASVCVEDQPAAHDVIVAVSRYSGEPDLDLAFELGVELRDAGSPCR